MTESSGINKTQVWVAVITVVGSLLTAIIVNADKWFDRDATDPVASPTVPATDQPGGGAPALAAGTVVTPVAIAGDWRSDDGSRFTFRQSGSRYEYTHTTADCTVGSTGSGTIAGDSLSHTFEAPTGENGTCTGRVNASSNQITGVCRDQNDSWSFVIDR